jgi:predicted AlkP superfamily pyrophosphatase or phosphodiesterase
MPSILGTQTIGRSAQALLTVVFVLFSAACSGSAPAATPQSEAGFARANAAQHLDKPYVVLISIDGYRHDYTDLYAPSNLSRFARQGVQADSLIPTYPADTFPSHYSIATGMYPGKHGIVANDFLDRSRNARYRLGDAESVGDGSWYRGTPLWVAAEQQGMVTASYFWVGTEAAIQGTRPSHYHRYDASVPYEDRIQAVLDWLSFPTEYRPHLITLYFSAVDSVAHRSGSLSAELEAAIEQLDSQIGALIEGIDALDIEANVFVISDHGMIDLDADKVIYLDEIVDLEGARVIGSGAHAFLYVEDGSRRSQIYADLKGRENNYRIYRREDTPSTWHLRDERVGDLVVEAEAPYSIRINRTGPSVSAASHGYDAARQMEMHGIFYAQGPQLREETRIPSFENVHIYPLIMTILGLETVDDIDGSIDVLEGILR